ncbi:hypothetical protein D3C87_1142720 [compost metagenome]
MRILLAVLASLFIAMITQFTPAFAATASAQDQSCSLMSEGIYHGSWMKHRIVIGEDVLFGANDLDAIIAQLDSLRGQGLCR